MKEFVFDDRECYDGVEDSTSFLTSQDRQSIVKNVLYSLQAKDGDQLGKIKFLEGQGIGLWFCDMFSFSQFDISNKIPVLHV